MRGSIVAIMLLTAACAEEGNAGAMSGVAEQQWCQVVDAAKLPAEVGGAAALCDAIKRAATASAPGVGFSVEVRVLSSRSLAAVVKTADGRSLPEQRMAVSDRTLGRSSIGRFADAIALALANAGS